jgi:serine/threonine protein kinase/tetratricopeptide (TPR) repeat protein
MGDADDDKTILSSDEDPFDSDETHHVSSGEQRGTPAASRSPKGVTGFAAGDVVAGRYRIIRMIDRGGMGEVYEAEDQVLKGRVALKTIRPEISIEPQAAERFKREVHLARKITHPNVCRIYDLGTHETDDVFEGGESVLFLTMELLEGQNLRRMIASFEKLSQNQILKTVDQLAAGLDAAHSIGIVHRDFKSANVFIDQAQSGGTNERVVITDFGLARTQSHSESLLTLSDPGAVLGTPAYMAPEQVQGHEVTAAADIYALGLVIYEMVTGVLPFEGGSPLSVAARRLTEEPPPPTIHVPDLDPVWEQTILRCLDRAPENRFKSAGEVAAALRGEEVPHATRALDRGTRSLTPTLRARSKRTALWLGITTLIVAAALVGGWVLKQRWSGGAAEEPVQIRPTVAVLDFKNISEDTEADWISTAIAEMLRTELGAGDDYRLIGGAEVAELKRNLGVNELVEPDLATFSRLKTTLGADLAATGTFSRLGSDAGGLVRIDLRIYDTSNGDVAAEEGTSGTDQQLFELVVRASAVLREALGMSTLSPEQALAVKASMPVDATATRFYSLGVEKARAFDLQAARQFFQRAIEIEPDHPMPHHEHANVLMQLGYEEIARKEATRAVELSSRLPMALRMLVEARSLEASSDPSSASGVYSSLFELYPDDLSIGLSLARMQNLSGNPTKALSTLDKLRKLPDPAGDDPRIELRATRSYFQLGDYESAIRTADLGIQNANAEGARQVAAEILLVNGTVLRVQGAPTQAMTVLEEARSTFSELGDSGGVSACLEDMATILRERGDLTGAENLLQRALEIHNSTGSESGAIWVMLGLGNLAVDRGEISKAKQLYGQALEGFSKLGAEWEKGSALINVGVALHLAGDLDGASETYTEALEVCEKTENRSGTAIVLTNFGEILYLRGELAQARQMHEDALSINRESGDSYGVAYDTYRLAEILFAQGDLLIARGRFEEVLTLQTELDDQLGASETELGLAKIDLEEGEASAALARCQRAGEIARSQGAVSLEIRARAYTARALTLAGEHAEASKHIEDLKADLETSEEPAVRAETARALVDVGIALSDKELLARTQDRLASIETEAKRNATVVLELESTLDLARIEAALAPERRNAARIQTLAARAEAAGFKLIARRANQLLAD